MWFKKKILSLQKKTNNTDRHRHRQKDRHTEGVYFDGCSIIFTTVLFPSTVFSTTCCSFFFLNIIDSFTTDLFFYLLFTQRMFKQHLKTKTIKQQKNKLGADPYILFIQYIQTEAHILIHAHSSIARLWYLQIYWMSKKKNLFCFCFFFFSFYILIQESYERHGHWVSKQEINRYKTNTKINKHKYLHQLIKDGWSFQLTFDF